MIKACIWDLDGTLLNTLEDLADAVNHTLAAHSYPERTLEEVRRFVGNGAALLIQRAVPAGTGTEDEARCLAEFRAYYQAHSQEKTRPYEGITELLQELKRRGIRNAVVSNKFEAAVKSLCDAYFPGLIDVAVGDQPGYRTKPAPDNLLRAMEALRVKREEVLYLGDSDVDVETAENTGVPCGSVLWGFRDRDCLAEAGARCFLTKPAELLRLLDELAVGSEGDR